MLLAFALVHVLLFPPVPASAQDMSVPLVVGDGPLPMLEAELRARCEYREGGFDCTADVSGAMLRLPPFAGPLDGRAELRMTASRVELTNLDVVWQAGEHADAGRGGERAEASDKTLPIRISGSGLWSSGGRLELKRLDIASDGLQGTGSLLAGSATAPKADLLLTVSDKGRFAEVLRRFVPQALRRTRMGKAFRLRLGISEDQGAQLVRLATESNIRLPMGGEWVDVPPLVLSATRQGNRFQGSLATRGQIKWAQWTARDLSGTFDVSLGPDPEASPRSENLPGPEEAPESATVSGFVAASDTSTALDSASALDPATTTEPYAEHITSARVSSPPAHSPVSSSKAPSPTTTVKARANPTSAASTAISGAGRSVGEDESSRVILHKVSLALPEGGLLMEGRTLPVTELRLWGTLDQAAGRADMHATVNELARLHLVGTGSDGPNSEVDPLADWSWELQAPDTDLANLGGVLAAVAPSLDGWMFSGMADLRARAAGRSLDARLTLKQAGFMSADGETLGDKLDGTVNVSQKGRTLSLDLDLPTGEALAGIYYCNFAKYPLKASATLERSQQAKGAKPAVADVNVLWQGVGKLAAQGTFSKVDSAGGISAGKKMPRSSSASRVAGDKNVGTVGGLKSGGGTEGEGGVPHDSGPPWTYAVDADLDVPDLSGPFALFVSGPQSMEGTTLTGGARIAAHVAGAGPDADVQGSVTISKAGFASPSITVSGINLDLPITYALGPQAEADVAAAPAAGATAAVETASGTTVAGTTATGVVATGGMAQPGTDSATRSSGSSSSSDAEPSVPRWGSLSIDSVESGFAVAHGLGSPAALVPGRLLLPGKLSAVVYGGNVELSDTVVVRPLSGSWRLASDVSLHDISMAAMSTGALLLDGSLGGDLGRVGLSARKLTVPGAIAGSFFGGALNMDGIYMTDPLRSSREYGCSINVNDLDMEKLSGALGIGRITGALDMDLKKLVMAYGQPASFDLMVRSDDTVDSDQTVSLEAVNSLSVIGTGTGLAGVGVGVFASFFKEFSYKYIGFRCVLKNDTFRVRGLKTEGGLEYLIRKPFLFGINVVNSNPDNVISFSDMLERIERVVNPSSSMEFGMPDDTDTVPDNTDNPEE